MIFIFHTLFFVLVAVLLVERFFNCSKLRPWDWVARYYDIIDKRFAGKSSMLIVLIMLLPIAIVIALLEMNLRLWLYGLLGILFEFVILLYCLGPSSAWQDVEHLKLGATEHDPLPFSLLNVESNTLSSGIWLMFERRVLSPIFWFVVLGAGGVFFYRMTEVIARILSKKSESAPFAARAKTLLYGLDWLPIRINGLLFALGGHFALVIAEWKKSVRSLSVDNETMLAKCGNAGLGIAEGSVPMESTAFVKEAANLIERTIIIFMVILAVLVLVV